MIGLEVLVIGLFVLLFAVYIYTLILGAKIRDTSSFLHNHNHSHLYAKTDHDHDYKYAAHSHEHHGYITHREMFDEIEKLKLLLKNERLEREAEERKGKD